MGEIIEFTSWPRHHNIFYRVSSGAIWFEVKAAGNAAIGLARKPGSECDYWIGIGDSNRIWIKHVNAHTVHIPNLISTDEWRKFWITWHGDSIEVGRGGETTSLISYVKKELDIGYITFSVIRESNPVHWKLELPPLSKEPKIIPVSGGLPTWVEANNQLPDNALIGGYEKEPLYIIRSFHRGSLTPGKFVPSEGTGYISWGGDSISKNQFEVLCGYDCIWVPTSENKIPVDAVLGGYSEDHFERLFIGRAEHEGHWIPGKVQPTHKVCYIPYKGKEIAKKKFEILIRPQANPHSVKKQFMFYMQVESASDSEDGIREYDSPGDDDYEEDDDN